MIQKYNDTLSNDTIDYIFNYLKNILSEDVWSSSNGWNQDLVPNSTNILTHLITDKYLHRKIKKHVEDKINLQFDNNGLEFTCSIYLWGGGSYITWHEDSPYPYNGTIYLNTDWNSNDGGVFLYRDNKTNQILGIEPEYNSMVVNYATEDEPHSSHCVTCILPSAVKKRLTIQWRTTLKRSANKRKVVYQ